MMNPGIKALLRRLETKEFKARIGVGSSLSPLYSVIDGSAVVRNIMARCRKRPVLAYKIVERMHDLLQHPSYVSNDSVYVVHLIMLSLLPNKMYLKMAEVMLEPVMLKLPWTIEIKYGTVKWSQKTVRLTNQANRVGMSVDILV